MNRQEFESLVKEALDSLPEEFIAKFNNLDVVVEEWPSSEQLRSARVKPPHTLFGLYQGVPQTKRRGGFQLPDKISIFAGPIISVSRTHTQVKQKVSDVVRHEIAHHFGMDEHSIQKRGY